MLGKVRGVVDDHDAPGALERTEREILLHLADLLDRDEFPVVAAVLIHQPHHDADVRMRPVLDLAAGETPAAAAGGARLARAEKGLREPGRHRALADRSRDDRRGQRAGPGAPAGVARMRLLGVAACLLEVAASACNREGGEGGGGARAPAPAERCAKLRTSLATTAKPRPWSPARAASTAALSARMLVWKAMLSMSPTISPTRRLDCSTLCISWAASLRALRLRSAMLAICTASARRTSAAGP